MATVPVLSAPLAGPVARLAAGTVPRTGLRALSGKAHVDVVRTIEDLYRRVNDLHAGTVTLAQGLATATAPAPAPATVSVGGATNQAVAAALSAAAGAGGGAAGSGSSGTGTVGPAGPPGPPGVTLDDLLGDDEWLLASVGL